MFDLTIKPIHIICNGQETKIWPESEWTIGRARSQALAESGNTGRAFDEWELRDVSGRLVEPEDDAKLYLDTYMFATIKIGAGGSTWKHRSRALLDCAA